jgi:hypothetical protein
MRRTSLVAAGEDRVALMVRRQTLAEIRNPKSEIRNPKGEGRKRLRDFACIGQLGFGVSVESMFS